MPVLPSLPILPRYLDYFTDFASNITQQAEEYHYVDQANELWDWILELLTRHNLFRPEEVDFLGDPFITFSHQAITVYLVWFTSFLLFLILHMLTFTYYGDFNICKTVGLLRWIYELFSMCVDEEPNLWPLEDFSRKINATDKFLATILWPIYNIPFNFCWLHGNCNMTETWI